MNTPTNIPQDLTGLDEVQHIIWGYQNRSHTYQYLVNTAFYSNEAIAIVHVEDYRTKDQIHLNAYDQSGQILDSTIILDHYGHGMPEVSDFRIPVTFDTVPLGSDLDKHSSEGWCIDMQKLRNYNVAQDIQKTQRTIFTTLLQHMSATNEVTIIQNQIPDAI